MRQLYSILVQRLLVIAFFAALLIVIATGNRSEVIVTYNNNSVKSVEAMHIVNKYNSLTENLKTVSVTTMREVALYGPTSPVKFTGEMTGYGPDCVGCSGIVGCPPRQDVRNGNIYFDDQVYGRVRILAADGTIPCGSIIKISNLSFSAQPVIGIVMDRGSAIKGTTIDYLVESTAYAALNIGRQTNISFEIVRWGW